MKLRYIIYGIIAIAYAIVYASTAYEFYIKDYFEAIFLLTTSVLITMIPLYIVYRMVRARNCARSTPIIARDL